MHAPAAPPRRAAAPLWGACVALCLAALVLIAVGPGRVLPSDIFAGVGGASFVILALTFASVGAIVARRVPENRIGWIFLLTGLANTVQVLSWSTPTSACTRSTASLAHRRPWYQPRDRRGDRGAARPRAAPVSGRAAAVAALAAGARGPARRDGPARARRDGAARAVRRAVRVGHEPLRARLPLRDERGRPRRAGSSSSPASGAGAAALVDPPAASARRRAPAAQARARRRGVVAAAGAALDGDVVHLADRASAGPDRGARRRLRARSRSRPAWRSSATACTRSTSSSTARWSTGRSPSSWPPRSPRRVLLGTALGRGSAWATAGATLVVAVAFRPLRARVQDAVDRRFNRARYDALRRMAGFLEDLRAGRAAPEEVEGVLRELLAIRGSSSSSSCRERALRRRTRGPGAGLRRRARSGSRSSAAGSRSAWCSSTRRGEDRATCCAGSSRRGGLAIEIARLRVELRRQLAEVEASRARIVAAGNDERRRIERDLHDGAQQRLVSIGLALRHAQHELGRRRPSAASATLDGAVAEIAVAIDELRELARGLPPAAARRRAGAGVARARPPGAGAGRGGRGRASVSTAASRPRPTSSPARG